ncbi:hypothetical protein HII17_14220 [Thalassotalea sp. M1531]|uniref:DUF2059 domain-containing protein n=1 Tax=Thalassotalea algicola TaxID=2716224 RepID=A0A7Y0LEH8_9GAMM|nr:hypothetical protein [Thalassotalea algicola]NMP32714.1 hypothetical protein [Thalassotalea algicola]
MKNFLYALGLLLLSTSALAEQALSKVLIEKYMQTVTGIEPIIDANPQLEQAMDNVIKLGKDKAIAKVKSFAVYPQIAQKIESAGFGDFEEFFDIGIRIMGGLFKSQLSQMPNGMTFDDYIAQMEGQVAMMKQQGLPENMVAPMEKQYKEQLDNMRFMQKAAESVSAQDAKFVNDNIEWITQIMGSEEDNL